MADLTSALSKVDLGISVSGWVGDTLINALRGLPWAIGIYAAVKPSQMANGELPYGWGGHPYTDYGIPLYLGPTLPLTPGYGTVPKLLREQGISAKQWGNIELNFFIEENANDTSDIERAANVGAGPRNPQKIKDTQFIRVSKSLDLASIGGVSLSMLQYRAAVDATRASTEALAAKVKDIGWQWYDDWADPDAVWARYEQRQAESELVNQLAKLGELEDALDRLGKMEDDLKKALDGLPARPPISPPNVAAPPVAGRPPVTGPVFPPLVPERPGYVIDVPVPVLPPVDLPLPTPVPGFRPRDRVKAKRRLARYPARVDPNVQTRGQSKTAPPGRGKAKDTKFKGKAGAVSRYLTTGLSWYETIGDWEQVAMIVAAGMRNGDGASLYWYVRKIIENADSPADAGAKILTLMDQWTTAEFRYDQVLAGLIQFAVFEALARYLGPAPSQVPIFFNGEQHVDSAKYPVP